MGQVILPRVGRSACVTALSIVCLAASLAAAASAGPAEQTFSLPGSVLLFGDYNDLRLISPAWARQLRPPVDVGFNHGYFAKPALAPRGDTIAWGFATEAANDRELKVRFALGLYSLSDERWSTYGDFDRIGDVTWSSTGTKIALIVKKQEKFPFLIFDAVTRTFGEGLHRRGMSERSSLSWSADESRVVMEIYRSETERVFIAVVNLKTGDVQEIGDGFSPRWSPDGEWIAYYSGRRCMVVRPDGTGSRVALTLEEGGVTAKNFVRGSPVWSPDSKQLLLNITKNDGPALDVVLLDLASGRTTTKLESGLPVFGWAAVKQ
jgi:Tol biopolymer transport system component